MQKLELGSQNCAFCLLMFTAAKKRNVDMSNIVEFRRIGSILKIDHGDQSLGPVLSLCIVPGI